MRGCLGKRISYLFSVWVAFPVFILAILVLFSGSSPSFLPSGQLLTVNLSQIGRTSASSTADLSKCKRAALGSDLLNDIGNGVDCGVEKAKNGAQNIQNTIADTLAEVANIPGFVDLHVMTFCTGQYDPKDYVAKGIADPKKKISFCSPKTTDFNFSLTTVVQNALPKGVTLQDIKWPDEITKAEGGLRTTVKAIFVIYAIGVGAAAFVTVTSSIGIFITFNMIPFVNMAVSGLGIFALLIASAASTATIKKIVPLVNQVGGPIGIGATEGMVFIGLTWAATLLLLIPLFIAVGLFRERNEQKPTLREKLSNLVGSRGNRGGRSMEEQPLA